MLKTFALCLLLAASSYCYSQSSDYVPCPNSPDVYIDKDGYVIIPDLITGLQGKNPQSGITYSQSPSAGSNILYSIYGPIENKEVRITEHDSEGSRFFCSVTLKTVDTIPPKFTSKEIGIGFRMSGNYCAMQLTYNPWSLYMWDNSGGVEVVYPSAGTYIPIIPGKYRYEVMAVIKDHAGNTTQQLVSIGMSTYSDFYPDSYEVNTSWAADKTINCADAIAPSNTGSTISSAPNKPCQPVVTYSDLSTQGTDPAKADYYNYTISRSWKVAAYFKDEVTQVQTITVHDVTTPVLSGITPSLATLPSGGNKYYDVALNYTSTDGCSPVKNTVTITSNEKAKGNGNKQTEWEIVNDHLVRLKAENGNGGEDRVYTITVTSEDVSGNKTSKSTTVTVVKAKGKKNEMAGSVLSANLQIVEAGGLQLSSAPNPSTTAFTIRIAGGSTKDKVILKVTNSIGQVVDVRAVGSEQTITLGSSYQSGVYYVEAIQGRNKASLKLVKTK